MKKILILVCMVVFSFGLMSCGGGGNSNTFAIQIHFFAPDLSKPTIVPVGEGATFSVTVTQNGKEVDPSAVTISTFKDSSIGQLRIWNDGGTINFHGDKITKQYSEVTDCKVGAVSGSGKFGLIATYKGYTAKITLSTN